jgi:hypothetical protein
MQQRMKVLADRNRTEREFAVGDVVFLRLQPYLQQSVHRRHNHKLSFKFFGPFAVIERIGQVAYKLDLPTSSRVHPVFHVSQLKACVGPGQPVSPHLPAPDFEFQVPMQILQTRARVKGRRTVAQVLVQWSGSPASTATWEDHEELRQLFPHAPAWGQAGFQEGGNVSDQAPPAEEIADQVLEEKKVRPARVRRAPAWLATDEWDRRFT